MKGNGRRLNVSLHIVAMWLDMRERDACRNSCHGCAELICSNGRTGKRHQQNFDTSTRVRAAAKTQSFGNIFGRRDGVITGAGSCVCAYVCVCIVRAERSKQTTKRASKRGQNKQQENTKRTGETRDQTHLQWDERGQWRAQTRFTDR